MTTVSTLVKAVAVSWLPWTRRRRSRMAGEEASPSNPVQRFRHRFRSSRQFQQCVAAPKIKENGKISRRIAIRLSCNRRPPELVLYRNFWLRLIAGERLLKLYRYPVTQMRDVGL